jgi:hypothetical protein
MAAFIEQTVEALTTEELQQLTTLLQKVRDNLPQPGDE